MVAACDSLQHYQEKEIRRQLKIEAGLDSTVASLTKERDLANRDVDKCDQQRLNDKKLIALHKKKARRRGFIIVLIVAGWTATEVW